MSAEKVTMSAEKVTMSAEKVTMSAEKGGHECTCRGDHEGSEGRILISL